MVYFYSPHLKRRHAYIPGRLEFPFPVGRVDLGTYSTSGGLIMLDSKNRLSDRRETIENEALEKNKSPAYEIGILLPVVFCCEKPSRTDDVDGREMLTHCHATDA